MFSTQKILLTVLCKWKYSAEMQNRGEYPAMEFINIWRIYLDYPLYGHPPTFAVHSPVSILFEGLPRWCSGKELACQARDTGLIPGSGRSLGEGNDSHPVFLPEEPGWLQSIGLQRAGHDLVTKQQQRFCVKVFHPTFICCSTCRFSWPAELLVFCLFTAIQQQALPRVSCCLMVLSVRWRWKIWGRRSTFRPHHLHEYLIPLQ